MNPWSYAWQTSALPNYAISSNKEMFIIISIGFTLFLIGLFGIFLSRKNLIVMLMSIELVLLALNFLFITASSYLDNSIGAYLFPFYVLVVAAAESAIGLSLLISYFRLKGTIAVQFIHLLKG